jgi:hypothetical protein
MRIVVLLLLGLSVAACQTVRSDVTVFHDLPDAAPRTFSIASAQEQSLEARSYSNLVGSELTERGWTRRDVGGDLLVRVGYGIDNGQTVTGSVPIFGQTGGGTSFTNGTIAAPGGFATYTGTTYTPATYGIVGDIPVSNTLYNRILTVTMDESKTGKRVFEGTVRSKGQSGSFAVVARCLVNSLFKNFPGQNGTTVVVVIPASECETSK